MITTKKINVKINSKQLLNYYNDKGYNTKIHDTIEVDIQDLHHSTGLFVEIKCDTCGHEFRTTSAIYINRFKTKDKHNCKACRYDYVDKKIRQGKQKKRKLSKEEFSRMFRQV